MEPLSLSCPVVYDRDRLQQGGGGANYSKKRLLIVFNDRVGRFSSRGDGLFSKKNHHTKSCTTSEERERLDV